MVDVAEDELFSFLDSADQFTTEEKAAMYHRQRKNEGRRRRLYRRGDGTGRFRRSLTTQGRLGAQVRKPTWSAPKR